MVCSSGFKVPKEIVHPLPFKLGVGQARGHPQHVHAAAKNANSTADLSLEMLGGSVALLVQELVRSSSSSDLQDVEVIRGGLAHCPFNTLFHKLLAHHCANRNVDGDGAKLAAGVESLSGAAIGLDLDAASWACPVDRARNPVGKLPGNQT